MVRFLICNLFLCGIIGIFLAVRRVLGNHLSSRLKYDLWYILLGLLALPFVPLRPAGPSQILSFFDRLQRLGSSGAAPSVSTSLDENLSSSSSWMNEFVLSVKSKTPSAAGSVLFAVWAAGVLFMLILVIRSSLKLRALKESARTLQNAEVLSLYRRCLKEAGIKKAVPVYSAAFLQSPVIAGLVRPRIYVPLDLILDFHERDMRYMLLHELQHYKHKDNLSNYLANLATVFYWFNPLIWYAVKEMRNDREIACDTSVLELLEEDSYQDYGHTLLDLAGKLARQPFPFAAGVSGNMKQMKRRILNIASYEKPTFGKRLRSLTAFTLTAVCLLSLAPFVSSSAAGTDHYRWDSAARSISKIDVSTYFEKYDGSFVLYDAAKDSWRIYNMENALTRVSPDSTYKIYDALFGLEERIISPEDSLLPWDGTPYPFEEWNRDQTLGQAMESSTNWYFQEIDRKLAPSRLQTHLREIGYGNEDTSGGLSSWMESSLKISPVEQVELLKKLHGGSLGFSPENISAVKDSIRLLSTDAGALYGKTGTGRVNGKDINGWFVGFIETADGNTFFFAANIQDRSQATGSNAAEITLSILSELGIWA